jgi:hypothetical protein
MSNFPCFHRKTQHQPNVVTCSPGHFIELHVFAKINEPPGKKLATSEGKLP